MNMELRDILTIAAIVVSPIVAVAVTFWWQRRNDFRSAKERLFLTLMAHRKAYPPTVEWVNALNVIEVVFAGHAKVVRLWHEYYSCLANPPANQNYEARDHAYLSMLSEMAKSLGYQHLQQTDIDKFYSPQSHATQQELNYQCQMEWLRVLQNTGCLLTAARQTGIEEQQTTTTANIVQK